MFKQQIEQMALIKNLTASHLTPHISLHLELHKQSVSSLGSCYANLRDEAQRGSALVIQHPCLERQDALLQSAA